jgi:hypothetical protein
MKLIIGMSQIQMHEDDFSLLDDLLAHTFQKRKPKFMMPHMVMSDLGLPGKKDNENYT